MTGALLSGNLCPGCAGVGRRAETDLQYNIGELVHTYVHFIIVLYIYTP